MYANHNLKKIKYNYQMSYMHLVENGDENDRESSNANFTMISSNDSIEVIDINKN